MFVGNVINFNIYVTYHKESARAHPKKKSFFLYVSIDEGLLLIDQYELSASKQSK